MDPTESFLISERDYIIALAQVFVGEHPNIEVVTSLAIDAHCIELAFSFLPSSNTNRPVVYDEFKHPRLGDVTADELETVRSFIDFLRDDHLAHDLSISGGQVTFKVSLKSAC